MIERGEEERIDLDRIADGLSEVRPYKNKELKAEEKRKKKNGKVRKSSIALLLFSIALFLGVVGYVTVLHGNIPFVVKWRNIWIETAMTTDQHKWLATWFFPDRLINEIMADQFDNKNLSITQTEKKEEVVEEEEKEILDIYGNMSTDILGQSYLVEGEEDPHGTLVYANDVEQGIVIIDVKKSQYRGKLVMIDDPSRVYLSTTNRKGSIGQFICDYLEKEDAVLGINASGFKDPEGHGIGGVVTGQCVSHGEYWGYYRSKYSLVGFDDEDRLVVGGISNWKDYNIRDGMQYRPTLIIDGEKQVKGSGGWGVQPRTVVGQASNGVVFFLVIDGRKVGYSLGATMGECADLLLEYGAVTAGACDGGSSSVLAYNGELINRPSTTMPKGRYLPNAWVVAPKSADDEQGDIS